MDGLSEIVKVINDLGDGPFRILVVLIAYFAFKEFGKMRKSVDALNKTVGKNNSRLLFMAKIQANHGKRIQRLELGNNARE